MTDFSVVIPVKDRVEELKVTVNSVCSQSLSPFEILIIENNSNQKSISEIEDYKNNLVSSGFKVKIYNMKECSNANIARNFGFEKSQGDFVAYLDSDDTWDKDYLMKVSAIIDEKPDVEFIYSGARIFDGEHFLVRNAKDIRDFDSPLEYLFGLKNAWAQSSGFVLKNNVLENKPWDVTLKRNQDLDLFITATNRLISFPLVDDFITINWERNTVRNYDSKSIFDFINKHGENMTVWSRSRFSLRNLKVALQHKDFATCRRIISWNFFWVEK